MDILISFDTTGSMRTCIRLVRQQIQQVVKQLFADIPGLRIGLIGHGDWCDKPRHIYMNQFCTKNQAASIVGAAQAIPDTSGGDSDEFYEYVMHVARTQFEWSPDGKKAMVLIGDANPHPVGYYRGAKDSYNWRTEAELLAASGIALYPVQALGSSHSEPFYKELAKIHGTPKLDLPQFGDIVNVLKAIIYQQAGQLDTFVEEVKATASPSLMLTLDKLSGKKLSRRSEVIGSKFQVLSVPVDTSIREFVEANGLTFEKGRGFYEWTKKETIQDYKEVVAQNLESGAIITGKRARSVLGIPTSTSDVKPDGDATHVGFVQSTSVNRKLKAGTKFLYEMSE